MSKNDGGTAFPLDFRDIRGMTMRDYFAAHAPTDPWPWFHPVMATPRPASGGEGYPTRTRDEIEAAEKATSAWEEECFRQRYIQWPWAYADFMLKER